MSTAMPYTTVFRRYFLTASDQKATSFAAGIFEPRQYINGTTRMTLDSLTFLALLILLVAGSAFGTVLRGHGSIKANLNDAEHDFDIAYQTWQLESDKAADVFLQIGPLSTILTADMVIINDVFGFTLSLNRIQPPRNFTLSSPVTIIYIVFNKEAAQGFEMEFSSVPQSQDAAPTDSVCGRKYVGYGIIKSPNYQEMYSSNVSCSWILIAYTTSAIFLRIRRFLATSEDHFVNIADASGFQMSLSLTSLNGSLTLSSPANISFISDYIYRAPIFEIEFRSVAQSKDRVCGGTIDGFGTIKSPNYPGEYSNSANCLWTIISYNESDIFLQIRYFSTEANFDFVLITDASKFQHSLSGKQQPRNFTLSTPAIISFAADSSITAQGFEMEFSSIPPPQDTACGGALFGYGIIKSPNFPENYYIKGNCSWTLRAYDSTAVILKMRYFSTELHSETLEISDRSGFQLKLSGKQPPRNITLSSPTTIFFLIDGDVTENGFEIEFSSKKQYEDSGCGGTIVGYGIIQFPNYTTNFTNNVSCFWILQAYTGGDIYLQIRRFLTQSGEGVVLIKDASGYQLSVTEKRQPYNVTLLSPANISFIIGGLVKAKEFEMEFGTIAHSEGNRCGGTMVGNGVIKYPKDRTTHFNNVNCLWTMQAYGTEDISLQIIKFSKVSENDIVILTDASGAEMTLPGNPKLQNITISSPAHISFNSTEFRADVEFEMSFNSIIRLQDQGVPEHDSRQSTIFASVIPLLSIIGILALTFGLLARKKRLHLTKASAVPSAQRVNGSEPPIALQALETVPESIYEALGDRRAEGYDNLYDEVT